MATEPIEALTLEEVRPLDVHARRSPTIGKLVAALAKAQLKFEAVKKDAENEFFKRGGRASKYATLDSVISATRKSLAENGLVIIALPEEMTADNRLKVISTLVHESDEYIESVLTMPAVEKVTPQELGKLITYARRYQWSGLTGTAPEDDTDANEASGSVGSREEAKAVGDAKVEELKAKAKKSYVPMLFYSKTKRGEYYIQGDKALGQANKDLLEPFFEADGTACVVRTEDEFQVLRDSLAHRNVPFQEVSK